MSGFIAIYNNHRKLDLDCDIYIKSLEHYGPDGKNYLHDSQIYLGHTLYKTTDQSVYDSQPSTIDQRSWIISSARIDARDELVCKLGLTQKLDLETLPDSHLILYAYRKWGEKCLEHLLGDFAFVIWNSQKKELFAARDRFGMKQLYFAQKDQNFLISNNLKTILLHPAISKEFSDKAIGAFLLFGDHLFYDKSLTAFKDIKSLEPAHYLIIAGSKSKKVRYWSGPKISNLIQYKKQSDYLEHFKEVFFNSIKDRMRTSSVVIQMSGGMDSTAIAAMASKLVKQRSSTCSHISAITVTHDKILNSEERFYADLVSKYLNIPIEYIEADHYRLLDPYVLTTRPMEIETPGFIIDFNRKVLQHSRVALVGYSADNLLQYSPLSKIERWKELNIFSILLNFIYLRFKYGSFPSLGLNLRKKLLFFKNRSKNKNSFMFSDSTYPSWINPDFEKSTNLQEMWESYLYQDRPSQHPYNPYSYNDLTTPDWNMDIIFDPYFTFPEIRDPYLDLRLIEFIFSLPPLPWLYKKHILRQSMSDSLPLEIINRPKTPLGNLQGALLKRKENRWIDDWTAMEDLSQYLLRDKVPSIIHSKSETLSYINQRPLILNLWLSHMKSSLREEEFMS